MSAESKYRMRPWLKVLLGVSLALNLAVAGIAIGSAWRYKDFSYKHKNGAALLGYLIMGDLDRETKREWRRKTLDRHGAVFGKRHSAMAEILRLIEAEPFDPEAVRSALRSDADGIHGFMLANHEQWVARLSDMSVEERAALTERFREKSKHWRKHRGGSRD
ncbi:hypothetical protein RSK20926_02724 [Roseobacter sp. SK209-2-6]|uniref:periplasmic heavy metal sensor n=1 Tax=Roseobacter sp. SK209-2-6 TaxID=388739 RepID=UPI0000F3EF52|nr:periplasmic heavy metal sensor [Roseobacter sp. SK209-2-6]EBA16683.1 hypothetical protein RSK20926_02724 [Roseobacter sp. SK209-2-6]